MTTHPVRRAGIVGAVALLLAACQPSATPSASDPAASPSSSADAPSATASPPASQPSSAEATASASQSTSGFQVAPHPEADSLFLDRDECENLDDGYRLEFPEEWFTNTAVGDVRPCQWFSGEFYEVDDPDQVPTEIAITIEIVQGDVGSINEIISSDEGIAGGTQVAHRFEERGVGSEGSEFPPSYRAYVYVVQLGPTPEEGPNLMAMTTTKMGGDYELNKAVLDRIMATIEFIGTIE
jgi:hypothetical protein